ncbi:MAG: helix-turn-helix domain-containing protein [Desulfovibrio sp.]|jgi:molybdate-binding protein/DNA-binding XRE family transcriptional regulator|nr:helix-turn-helix domain-containing protein [Desulfovibrio sp.]
MPEAPEIRCNLKVYRLRRGWSQEELARKVHIKRQAVVDLEKGRYLPNTLSALRLAKVFDCAVEDLFMLWEENEQELSLPDAGLPADTRLAVGKVRDRLVGLPLHASMSFTLRAADGLLSGPGRVRLHASPQALEESLLLAGCDPALDLLDDHLRRVLPNARIRCVFASSGRALELLAGGCIHAASSHFHNDGAGEANVEALRAATGGSALPCRVTAFANLEEGLMTAEGNPLELRSPEDLARPGVRFVNREPGAALRRLLDRHLAACGVPASMVDGYTREVGSHGEGACRTACGAADAALGPRAAADAFGLDFIPLAVTRCDVLIPLDLEQHPVAAALLDLLHSGRLRRELAALPGYDSSVTGKEIAVLA